MTVSELIKVMNVNIRLEFIDRNTRAIIERSRLSRKDLLSFLERKVYLITPTDEKDVLRVFLY